MMESKIEKKSFGIAEFSEEEKWLEEQHKNGCHFLLSSLKEKAMAIGLIFGKLQYLGLGVDFLRPPVLQLTNI